ncbi:hypothetical protein XENTR_v10015350 [Xenopus tropicalis]|nr:hypothetical protein XENTR_v10015350 [Xenopus tropicalis]
MMGNPQCLTHTHTAYWAHLGYSGVGLPAQPPHTYYLPRHPIELAPQRLYRGHADWRGCGVGSLVLMCPPGPAIAGTLTALRAPQAGYSGYPHCPACPPWPAIAGTLAVLRDPGPGIVGALRAPGPAISGTLAALRAPQAGYSGYPRCPACPPGLAIAGTLAALRAPLGWL